MRILQLYLPWRDENDLLHADGTYATMLHEVFDEIKTKIQQFEKCSDVCGEDLENGHVSDSDEGEHEEVRHVKSKPS